MLSRWALSLVLGCLSAECYAASITVKPLKAGEAALFVEGEILLSDAEQFRSKISPYTSGLVVFSSKGGSVVAGIQIGNTIRLRRFLTLVPTGSTCASACALAWLGGTERLMGNPALIGFHAAFRAEDGSESGLGNAVVGKYLADLGLSYSAIAYVTSARPESMTWMTPEDADKVGIDVAIFDPKDVEKPKPPPPKVDLQLRRRAAEFLKGIYSLHSAPNERMLPALSGMYADNVQYFGKSLSRIDVVDQLTRFADRWPQRVYKPKDDSVEIVCDEEALTCRAKGVLDFDSKSPPRNQRSWGTASFEFGLVFTKDGTPKIAHEAGSPMERQIGPLRLEPRPHGKD